MPEKQRDILIVYLPKPMIRWLREDARQNGDIPSRALERVLEHAGIGRSPDACSGKKRKPAKGKE